MTGLLNIHSIGQNLGGQTFGWKSFLGDKIFWQKNLSALYPVEIFSDQVIAEIFGFNHVTNSRYHFLTLIVLPMEIMPKITVPDIFNDFF